MSMEKHKHLQMPLYLLELHYTVFQIINSMFIVLIKANWWGGLQ